LNTPYADLVPAMSDEDFATLKADLRLRGQRDPILVDDQRNILDGHNRYAILGSAVTMQVIDGWSEAEKKAFVVSRQLARRNITAEQRREIRESQKRIAFELRSENPRVNTQERIASMLGVSQQVVSHWLADVITNVGKDVADARLRHPPEV